MKNSIDKSLFTNYRFKKTLYIRHYFSETISITIHAVIQISQHTFLMCMVLALRYFDFRRHEDPRSIRLVALHQLRCTSTFSYLLHSDTAKNWNLLNVSSRSNIDVCTENHLFLQDNHIYQAACQHNNSHSNH